MLKDRARFYQGHHSHSVGAQTVLIGLVAPQRQHFILGWLAKYPLTFGVGSNEQVFGSGADSGTFAGFGFMPTANDSAKADAKQSAADNGNAGDDGSAGSE